MQAGDPFAPFFGALQNFNELVFRGGAPDVGKPIGAILRPSNMPTG